MDKRHINLIEHAQRHMQAYLSEHPDDGIPLLLGSFLDANDYLIGGLNAIPFKELRLYCARFKIRQLPYNMSTADANPKFVYGEQLANHAVIMVLRQPEAACLRSLILTCVDKGISWDKISILSPCLSKDELDSLKKDFGRTINLLDERVFTEGQAMEWRKHNIPPRYDDVFPDAVKVLVEHNGKSTT